MIDVEQAWIDHLGTFQPRYPREVCYHVSYGMVRFQADNPTTYVNMIHERVDRGDIWVCTRSIPQIETDVWDKAYIDIDVPDGIQVAYQDKVDLESRIKQTYGVSPRVAFTANKGFAVYLDFLPQEMDAIQVKLFCHKLTSSLGIHSDPVVNGDKRRISRLPYTFNYKSLKTGTLRMCIPVKPEWSLDRVLAESRSPSASVDWSPRPCPEVARDIVSIPVPKVVQKDPTPEVAPEALEAMLSVAEFIGDGRHRAIFKIIMPLCVQAKFTKDQAMDYTRRFIEKSGKGFYEYEKYSAQSYDWCAARPDLKPMKLERMMEQNPEIAEAFVRVGREQGF